MREWGVPISVPHKVLGGTGIKFFEFDSQQKLLDIMSQHCGPLDEWPYVQPYQHIKTFFVLAWRYVSNSRQRGVTERKRDWKRDWNRPGI